MAFNVNNYIVRSYRDVKTCENICAIFFLHMPYAMGAGQIYLGLCRGQKRGNNFYRGASNIELQSPIDNY